MTSTASRRCCSRSPTSIEDLVVAHVGSSALFASRFRENAARALLLPRRRPGQRSPLWQQRQRAAGLLQVASRYGSFPILVETYRECLSDVFDLPALRDLLGGIARREIAVHSVETTRATPFASSLLFDYIAAFMYDGDAPLAERRAQALTLDRDLLRELLGQEELRELLDPAALADLELVAPVARRGAPGARPPTSSTTCCGASATSATARSRRASRAARRSRDRWLEELAGVAPRGAGPDRRRAALDRDGGRRALSRRGRRRSRRSACRRRSSARRRRRSRACSRATRARMGRSSRRSRRAAGACRSGSSTDALERLLAAGSILRGEFRPGGAEREWCDPEVLRQLRRRSLARLRQEVEPVEPAALGRFLPSWQGVAAVGRAGAAAARPGRPGTAGRGRSTSSPGWPCPRRCSSGTSCRRASPATRRACSTSSARWARSRGWGAAASAATTAGSRCIGPAARACATPPAPAPATARPTRPADPRHEAIRGWLNRRGASFYRELFAAAGGGSDRDVLDALWDLVWAGEVSNDTFAPLRALRWRRPARDPRRRPARLTSLGPPEAAGRWSLVDADADADAGRGRRATRPRGSTRWALALLERYGVLTREAVAAEGVPGGFSAVYPILRALEDAGRVRRGYFVEGLGAAQFALPGRRGPAARRPRAATPTARWCTCWRQRTRRTRTAPRCPGRGAATTIAGRSSGRRARTSCWSTAIAALYVERGGKAIQTFPAADDPNVRPARARGPRPAGRGRSRQGARDRADRRPARRAIAVAVAPDRGGLHAGLPRPRAAARVRRGGPGGCAAVRRLAPQPCLRATPSFEPRPGCGRISSAAPSRRRGRGSPGPQAHRLIGSTVTEVEAYGKHLLIRFDSGLELRSHLGMNGSWHRYRPGERWRRAAVARPPRARGPGRRRRAVRCRGRRAVRDPRRAPPPGPVGAWAGHPRRATSTRPRRSAASRTRAGRR